jgi:REP element-mobilizing transposase RayT
MYKILLLRHLAFPAKYRREAFIEPVAKTLTELCFNISQRYEIHFVEIDMKENHMYFLELSRICGEKYRKTLILLAF